MSKMTTQGIAINFNKPEDYIDAIEERQNDIITAIKSKAESDKAIDTYFAKLGLGKGEW